MVRRSDKENIRTKEAKCICASSVTEIWSTQHLISHGVFKEANNDTCEQG